MLAQQQMLLSGNCPDLYNHIVPKENILRKISELIVFSFSNNELLNNCVKTMGELQ